MNHIYQFIQNHQGIDDVQRTYPNTPVPIIELIAEGLAYCHQDGVFCDGVYEQAFQIMDDYLEQAEDDRFGCIELDSFYRVNDSRMFSKLVKSCDTLMHGFLMVLHALRKGIDSAEQYEQGNDGLIAFGEAAEAIAHGRLYTSIMIRLDNEEEYWERIQFLESDTKQRRGGCATAKNLKETQKKYYDMAEKVAELIWNQYANISHRHMATLINEAIHEKYNIVERQNKVPSIRELSPFLEKLAPNNAPKRQSRAELASHPNYNNIIQSITDNLPT